MGPTENVGTGGGGVAAPALKNTCDGLRKSIMTEEDIELLEQLTEQRDEPPKTVQIWEIG